MHVFVMDTSLTHFVLLPVLQTHMPQLMPMVLKSVFVLLIMLLTKPHVLVMVIGLMMFVLLLVLIIPMLART